MRRYRQSLTLSLFATAVLALAVTAGCSFSEEGRAKETPMSTTNTRTIGAAGSTFIAPLMARWASSYSRLILFTSIIDPSVAAEVSTQLSRAVLILPPVTHL